MFVTVTGGDWVRPLYIETHNAHTVQLTIRLTSSGMLCRVPGRGLPTFCRIAVPFIGLLDPEDGTSSLSKHRTLLTKRHNITRQATRIFNRHSFWKQISEYNTISVQQTPTLRHVLEVRLSLREKYEGHLESKERFAIQRYLLIIGKKQNMQVLSHTFTYFST